MLPSVEKHLYIVSMLLIVLGIASSLWLLNLYINLVTGTGTLESACYTIADQGGGCETIAVSDYSKIWHIPLSALALGYYAVQLFLWLWMILFAEYRKGLLQTSFLLSTLALPITFCMIFISFFIVKELCLLCSLLWIINVLLWLILTQILGYYNFPFQFKMNTKSFSLNPHANITQAKITKSSLVISATLFAIILLINQLYMNKNTKENTSSINRIIPTYKKASSVFLPKEAYQGHVKGNGGENAAITILNFSDFQCPHCRKAAINFKSFYLKNKKDIHFIYRHYPLDPSCNQSIKSSGSSLSCKIATATECAAQQGKFYEMHDKVFDMQKMMSTSKLKEIAADLNLNMTEYESCLEDPKIQEKIQRDINFGNLANIKGTPTFIINGKKISRILSHKQWEVLTNFLKKQ